MDTRKGIAIRMVMGIVAAVIVVILGGVYVLVPRGADEKAIERVPEGVQESQGREEQERTTAEKDNVVTEKKEGVGMKEYASTVLAGKSAPLLDFAKTDYDEAIASEKLVVLYFYANWCPTCKAEFPKMQAAFNELATDQVIGFRVNYKDNETDRDEEALARQFGVAYQHTKVFLKNGERILKAPDSWEQARYLSEISKVTSQ